MAQARPPLPVDTAKAEALLVPADPTAVQRAAEGHEMEVSGPVPRGRRRCAHLRPPSVVLMTAPDDPSRPAAKHVETAGQETPNMPDPRRLPLTTVQVFPPLVVSKIAMWLRFPPCHPSTTQRSGPAQDTAPDNLAAATIPLLSCHTKRV
jgi:hypothetical protein